MAERIECTDLGTMMQDMQVKMEAEREAYEKMSPAEKNAYMLKQQEQREKTEEILKELRGPGFMELEVKLKD